MKQFIRKNLKLQEVLTKLPQHDMLKEQSVMGSNSLCDKELGTHFLEIVRT
jgi:hypothetical protein